jgi:hypothetical protein
MSLGKTVLLSDGPAVERIPDTACLRVATGPAEQETLEAYMAWLAETPGAAAAIGTQAASVMREHHDVGKVARAYVDAMGAAAGRPG